MRIGFFRRQKSTNTFYGVTTKIIFTNFAGTDFFDRMASAGFETKKIDYVDKLHPRHVKQMNIKALPIIVAYKSKN